MTPSDHDDIDVLCVCTHNRSRSVMMAALLDHHLRAAGVGARVGLAGTNADGRPATDGARRQLAERGIDVGGHRSRPLDDAEVLGADLILTAERDHVVQLAGRWPEVFVRTFTLPEIVRRGAAGRRGDTIAAWLDTLNSGRSPGLDYLDAPGDDDLADPTGHSRRHWRASAKRIDELTSEVAASVAGIVAR